ncbi:MAG: adenylate kinase [Nanoarchaeota archaeon]
MNIIIIGPQGSGKGTQANKISAAQHIPHISSGDLFRDNIKKQTELGRIAQQYINQGKLVPDDVTDSMVRERLRNEDCGKGFILDGYPRNVKQVQSLMNIVHIDCVLDLEISDEEALERITGRRICAECGKGYHINFVRPKIEGHCDVCEGELIQRSDDEPEAIIKRLEIYHEQTKPLLDFFKERGMLRIVNGSQSVEEVFKDITIKLKRNI